MIIPEDEEDDKFYPIDGSGDGGIDIAYFMEGEKDEGDPDGGDEPDTWYIIQGKSGNQKIDAALVRKELEKIKNAFTYKHNTSNKANEVINQIKQFTQAPNTEKGDRVVILFATEDDISEECNQAIKEMEIELQPIFGHILECRAISIRNIYEGDTSREKMRLIKVMLRGQFYRRKRYALIGIINFKELYDFFTLYRMSAGSVDKIYEKNVRQFLELRGNINK